jgi:SIR2-like domain
MPKTVWILGAGFSQPLGAPLLRGLLPLETWDDVRAVFGNLYRTSNEALTSMIPLLYNYGTRFERGPPDSSPFGNGERLWEDAEDFLSYVDSPPGHGARLQQIVKRLRPSLNVSNEELASEARKLVAAQCSAFIRDAPVETERWSPHIAFAEFLRRATHEPHHLVTFNYDTAVERAFLARTVREAQATGVSTSTRLHVQGPDVYLNALEKKGAASTTLYKLHGSTNWYLRKQGSKEEWVEDSGADHDHACLNCDGELLIAAPGQTKGSVIGKLDRLWTDVRLLLREAEVIIFIGYRFPKSDAIARERILGAIRENTKPYLRIHTVLGPDMNHVDVIRLDSLLRYATKARALMPNYTAEDMRDNAKINERQHRLLNGSWLRLERYPMWTEDFLSLVLKIPMVPNVLDQPELVA